MALQPLNLQPIDLGSGTVKSETQTLSPELQAWKDKRDSGEPLGSPELSPMEAGWHASQGMMWTSLKAGAQAAGQEVPEYIQERIDENMQQAGSADIDGLGDKLQFAVGQLGPAAGAMVASAVVAPLVGATAAFGATAGGILASMGMTAGDQQMKAEELDPEHVATIGQLGYSALLTAPDALVIGKAKVLLSPMRDLIEETVKGNLKHARGVGGKVAELGATSLKIGAAEGAQDLGTGLGANFFTGTDIDQSRITALANSAVEEAVIGTILGIPLSGANMATAGVAQAQIEFDENRKLDLEGREQAPSLRDNKFQKGNISEEAVTLVPGADSVNNMGFFSFAYNSLTGNATAKSKAKYKNNKNAQTLLREFNLTAQERQLGGQTIPEKAQTAYANYDRAARDFLNATAAQQRDSWERKARGELDVENNPVDKSLRDTLNVAIPNSAWVASRGKMDMTKGLWTEENYLPNNIDWKLVVNDPNALIRAKDIMEAQGTDPKVIKARLGIIKGKMSDYNKYGNDMHVGADRKSKDIQNKLIAAIGEANKKGKKLKLKGLLKGMQSTYKAQQKKSAMTLERALGDLGQEWFTPYNNKSRSESEVLRLHMKMSSEAAAHIDSFGVDLEIFDDMVARAIVEAQVKGTPMTAADVQRFYDILRTSQRISLNPVTRPVREAQQKVRAGVTTMTLGLAALVSIPEALVIGLNTNMRSALVGLLSTMKIRDRQQMLVAAEDMGMALNTSANMTLNRIGEESVDAMAVESAFIKLTGLPYLQHFLTVWAAKSQDTYLRRQLNQMNSGKMSGPMSNHVYRKLAEAGINVDKAKDWAAKGYPKDDKFYQREYIPKLIQLTRDTIVDPNPVDKPLWMNDERFMLLAQLKGFMTVFTNRVMQGTKDKLAMEGPGANRELALRVAPYLTMYLLGQVAMGATREFVKAGEVDSEKDMIERMWAAFGYAGSVAYFTDAINSMRFRSDPTASAAGPAFSIGSQLAGNAVRNIEEMDAEGFVNDTIKRLFPNVPFKDLMLEGLGVE